MAAVTDPAREIANVCEKLANAKNGSIRGDDHLAAAFTVQAWSTEFYQIVFCIVERCTFLEKILNDLDVDDDIRKDAKKHLKDIGRAFSRDALANPWDSNGKNKLSRENVQAIKMISPQVRRVISYPKLSNEEITELVGLITELEEWLVEFQMAEHDFIRQAIIDGLRTVKFRLERVGWLGWGYTVESIREVIGAYLALQYGIPNDSSAPDAEAVLKKVGSFIRSFYQKTGLVKEVVETGEFFLKAYGAISLAAQGATVSGLITFGGGN